MISQTLVTMGETYTMTDCDYNLLVSIILHEWIGQHFPFQQLRDTHCIVFQNCLESLNRSNTIALNTDKWRIDEYSL